MLSEVSKMEYLFVSNLNIIDGEQSNNWRI